jgi:hypothetical protein
MSRIRLKYNVIGLLALTDYGNTVIELNSFEEMDTLRTVLKRGGIGDEIKIIDFTFDILDKWYGMESAEELLELEPDWFESNVGKYFQKFG